MDIRVDTKFFQHPKTLKLLRRLGPAGVVGLWRLWVWAAENRQTGYLHGLGPDDIDLIAAGGQIDPTDPAPVSFCTLAMELGWIDQDEEGGLCLHEWSSHNPWAADAPSRSDKARFSKLASVAPAAYFQLVREGKNSITAEEYRAVVESMPKQQRNDNEPLTVRNDRTTDADDSSTPSPSPSLTPSPSLSHDIKKDHADALVDIVNNLLRVYHQFPGYRADLREKELLWVKDIMQRFPALDIADEITKARLWIERNDNVIKVKNSRAYILRWLERVQKEKEERE